MLIESLVHLAGGIQNIRRILTPMGKINIAIQDELLVKNIPSSVSFDQIVDEWQLGVERDPRVTDRDLFELGRMIEVSQRTTLESCCQVTDSTFRPSWHISPPQGLINDPNGFIYYQEQYHIFYQWYPYSCAHKDKYWAHLTSSDLIDWSWNSVALTPSDWFDSHGVFSGHAVTAGDNLLLFYTGNSRVGNDRERLTTQCAAVSKDGQKFEKLGPVIDQLPEGVTPHIRDPKVIYSNGEWLMLLGAQTTDLLGRLAIYRSDDLKQWTFDRLYGDELGEFGYMWECPDYFELNGQGFLLFGPQGIQADHASNTVPHHNRIACATFDINNRLSLSDPQIVDHGFDFYAPQTLLTPDGRRVMCGWMGLPDEVVHPTTEHGWLHQLTMMREIDFKEGKLLHRPVKELHTLRGDRQQFVLNHTVRDLETKAFELQLTMQWGDELVLHSNNQYRVTIRLNQQNRTLEFDRSSTLIQQGDRLREVALSTEEVKLIIFSDASSLEIFGNEGEFVVTGRVFTPSDCTKITMTTGASWVDYYPLLACKLADPALG
jgi:beta-fructofuranosidase